MMNEALIFYVTRCKEKHFKKKIFFTRFSLASLIVKYNKLITERRNQGWSIDMIKLGVVISHQEIYIQSSKNLALFYYNSFYLGGDEEHTS